MHFVLIRFSSLGDVILQSPICAWLKFQFPNCKITFITSEEFSSLVTKHPYIDQVKTIKRLKGRDDIKQLVDISYFIENEIKADFIIDLHNTLRAKLIRFLSFKTPSVAVFKRNFLRALLIRFKVNFLKNMETHHERVINDMRFLFNQDFDYDEIASFNTRRTKKNGMGLTTVPKSFCETENLIEGEYIAISPIASFSTKRWPMKRFKELVESMLEEKELSHLKIVLVAGPNDSYCDEMLSEKINESNRFINLQGKTSIDESSIVLGNAKLCISNDTGTAHITEAFGRPVISIFGPTSESFGFEPHLELSQAISEKVWCRPCSGTGSKKCFRSEQFCMTKISSERILLAVKEILQRLQ